MEHHKLHKESVCCRIIVIVYICVCTLLTGLKILILSLLFLALQSAAMEETVIWEQHTVTLHRVSGYNS